ncbi:MAG: signal peptidase II [Phycisphaerae bacterium]|jgi:lipoprotein signal peptidase|nr:signal peptidase II [Phycisphaerae bacterium]
MRSGRAVCFFVAMTAIALAADLLSKHYVFDRLMPPPEVLAERIERIQAGALADPQIGRKLNSREMLHYLKIKKHVCPGLDLVLSANKGAVFGMELHSSGGVHRLIVSLATLVVTVLMACWFATSHRRAWSVHLSTALILAGAIGNLYDRMASSISLPGMEPILYNVRDFLDCSSIPLPFGFRYVWIFNIADVWLVVGVGMMMLHWIVAMFSERKHKAEAHGSKS